MRIWPAHVAVIVLSAIWIQIPLIQFHTERQTTSEVLQVIFLLQAWNPKPIVFWGLNGPSWSISVELFFYLAFPALLLVLSRIAAGWFLIGAFAVSLLWLVGASIFLFNPERQFHALAVAYIFPIARLAEFCAGMALSKLLLGNIERLRAAPQWLWTAVEVFTLCLVVLVVGNVGYISHLAGEAGTNPVFQQWIDSSGGVAVFALLIAVLAVGRGMVSRLLSAPVLVWLGRISFSMYLVHQPLIYHWTREVVPVQPSLLWQVVGYFLVLIGFSALLHSFVELPGVRAGKWLSGRLQGGQRNAPVQS